MNRIQKTTAKLTRTIKYRLIKLMNSYHRQNSKMKI